MSDDDDSMSISYMEELEPEPKRGRGNSYAREFVLGLILILGVLAWSGYQWIDGQRLSGLYHQAQQAEVVQNWDQALSLYDSIPGYKDSNSRASVAAKTIADRDKSYAQAVDATKKKDWPAALQAARNTKLAQAGYKNSNTLISDAEMQVYAQAISGTVALRTTANPPGLYYRFPRCWVWLQGSDERSQVRGLGPTGHLVYDVPDKNAPPVRTTITGTNPDGTPIQSGQPRKLALATIEGEKLTYQDLAFDPVQYPAEDSFFLWGDHGVWGLEFEYGYLPPETWGLRDEYNGYNIAYQAYGSRQARPVSLPYQSWQVMDLGPGGDSILVGAPYYVQSGAYYSMSLHLMGPDGTNTDRVIYGGPDTIRSAHFSPDQRYVLLNTYHPTNNYRDEVESVLLIDLQSGTQYTLAQQETGADTGRGFPAVGATFLTDGMLKGKVLLFGWFPDPQKRPVKEGGQFSLIDPARPDIPMSTVQSDRYPVGPVWISEGQGGRCLIVAWQNGLGNAGRYAEGITAVRLEPGRPGSLYSFQLGTAEVLTGAWLRDSNIVFSTGTPAKTGRGLPTVTVYSAGLTGNPAGKEVTLYRTAFPNQANFTYGRSIVAGPQVFAYLDNGQLHAKTYDGSIDLPLESGIANLYNFPYRTVHWLK